MAYNRNITDEEFFAMVDERLRRLEAILEKLLALPSEDAPEKSRGGRPRSPDSEATLKPWVDEGISRNTWYVRQRVRRAVEKAAAEERNKMASKPSVKPPAEDDTW